MNRGIENAPVIPLPNPGEGGPVAGGENMPVAPLPNPGEGGPGEGGPVAGGENMPVAPLPNPGEGGPVAGGENVPVTPLPNPGEGGPAAGGENVPVIPLPNPGEGGPILGGSSMVVPVFPRFARVRFLNAAFGYRPFRVLVNNMNIINWLNYASMSSYSSVPIGYQTVTIVGTDGYIYIQKSLPFQLDNPTTVAIINTPSGLDLLQISDLCCIPPNSASNFRVSNLALNSRPLDVLLSDGRVVYADVRYKDTTSFKSIAPGSYQFFFAETNLSPMPNWMDIETLDSAFVGMYPVPNTVASLYLDISGNSTYTVFLLSSSSAVNAIQTMVVTDH